MPRLRPLCGILVLVLCSAPEASADSGFSVVSFSLSGSPAGGNIIQSIGDTTNAIVTLIMGPGLYVVMAMGAVLALYGWGRGQKESLWTGLTLFVLAAMLKGLFTVLMGSSLVTV